jgi:hypothetical protein
MTVSKRFKHVNVYRKQSPTLIERYAKHVYQTPEGKQFPSITTKLSATKDYTGLNFWKRKVGPTVATHIMQNAAIIGTATHEMIEAYLNNLLSVEKRLLPKAHFNNICPFLNNIDNIHCTETALYSNQIETAGTVDVVGDYSGTLSIIDFKTSRRKKINAWIQDYFIQGAAYSQMYKEMSGIDINQIVILITAEDGSLSENIVKVNDYVPLLHEKLKMYDDIVSGLKIPILK